MKQWCVGFALFALSTATLTACNPGSATTPTTDVPVPTSVAIAAPTTSAPVAMTSITTVSTTSAPPTSVPSTVSPPTVAVPTLAEAAEAEIRATLHALDADFDACVEAPEACDIDALLATYFAPEDQTVSAIYRGVWELRSGNGQKAVTDGRTERTVVSITTDVDGSTGTSYHCEVDGTFVVPAGTPAGANTTVPPDLAPDYLRYYYEWQKRPGGGWVIVRSEFGGGTTPDRIESGELPSLTEAEISQCF